VHGLPVGGSLHYNAGVMVRMVEELSAGQPGDEPGVSVLASSAAIRIAVALALSGLLWLGVLWARAA
jgi:hypothetical protein